MDKSKQSNHSTLKESNIDIPFGMQEKLNCTLNVVYGHQKPIDIGLKENDGVANRRWNIVYGNFEMKIKGQVWRISNKDTNLSSRLRRYYGGYKEKLDKWTVRREGERTKIEERKGYGKIWRNIYK